MVHHEERRARILQAAGPIFAEKGFQTATVREICQAAGVNGASVNYYFGDKETLYIETVRLARQMRAAQVPMLSLAAELPPAVRLQHFARTLLTRMIDSQESSWQAELMTREILRPTVACRQLVHEYFRPEFDQLLGILGDLLPPATPQHVRQQLGFSLVGQCLFYRVASGVVAMLVPLEEQDSHYTVDQLAAHITRVILAAVGQAEPVPADYSAARPWVWVEPGAEHMTGAAAESGAKGS